jgi:hypothetical protein
MQIAIITNAGLEVGKRGAGMNIPPTIPLLFPPFVLPIQIHAGVDVSPGEVADMLSVGGSERSRRSRCHVWHTVSYRPTSSTARMVYHIQNSLILVCKSQNI